ncbi:hypothetical protein GMMP15_1030059 [Candidatus Magnetomoraceae bacterium gMMP-15]
MDNRFFVQFILARSAGREIGEKLMADIIQKWKTELDEIKIVFFINGLEDYNDFLNIREFLLEKAPLVSKIIMWNFFLIQELWKFL